MKNVFVIVACFCILSCNQKEAFPVEPSKEKKQIIALDFENPKFTERSEELMYIREYLEQSLPRLYLEKNPRSVKEMQEYQIVKRNYCTLERSAYIITNGSNLSEKIMRKAIEGNFTFEYIKSNISDYIPSDDKPDNKKPLSSALKNLLDGESGKEVDGMTHEEVSTTDTII